MRSVCFLAALALTAMPVASRADVLVELFTSQGCSSCPPADALLHDLAKRDDVVALAYHVDYWDYLGWHDTFAKPEFTARQRDYASKVDRQWIGRKVRGSFTPEMVVQGSDSLIGSSHQGVVSRIAAHAEHESPAEIELKRDGTALIVRIAPSSVSAQKARIVLALFTPQQTVDVKRGENAGRSITYSNIVTDLRVIGEWDGTEPVALRLDDVPGSAAVFLQVGKAGPVLAAEDTD